MPEGNRQRQDTGTGTILLNVLIIAAAGLTGAILLLPRLANAKLWRATVTPLASIIGSGFLVLGPILDASYGYLAPLVMAALCTGAWLFGGAIRFNIDRMERTAGHRSRLEERLETLASWSLAFAYFISVAYYLNLLGAFAVSLTELDDDFHARVVTSVVFALILLVGWSWGFKALERMEQASVGIKLAIIAGLLVGLGAYFGALATDGGLILNPPVLSGWSAIFLAFGLIVTVQGFETSRYLGTTYDARMRIRSMRLAQLLSTAIYLAYVCFVAYIFEAGTLSLEETAIIDLTAIVAPILPPLLVAAALSAQFSAAVADTGGAGGLLSELTGGKLAARGSYALLCACGLLMTWSLDVFEIISYASRAFALYYALQAAIAAAGAANENCPRWLQTGYAALAVLGAAIVIFGTAVE